MRRQLGLARRLVPILVRQQLRKEAAASLASSFLNSSAAGGVRESARERAVRLREEASAVALEAIDGLDAQVELLVGDVFAGFAAERISYQMWCDAWSRSNIHRLSGIDGILGALVQGAAAHRLGSRER